MQAEEILALAKQAAHKVPPIRFHASTFWVRYGRREEILQRREEQKQRAVLRRIKYNLGRRQTQTPGELRPETIA